MTSRYNNFINNHILTYSNVVSVPTQQCQNNVTLEKIAYDISKMKDYGFQLVTLKDFYENRINITFNKDDKKLFCVVILEFENDFQDLVSFVKKHNVNISLFIPINDKTKYETNLLQELINCNLVNIFPLWQYYEDYLNFEKEITKKIKYLNTSLTSNGEIFAFAGCKNMYIKVLNTLGIKLFLANRYNYKTEYLQDGSIPTVSINLKDDVIDMIDEHRAYYSGMFEISKHSSTNNIIDKSDFESVSLNIDYNPIIRNYLHHAVPMSIIGSINHDRALRIAINEFIDVIYKPSCEYYDYHNDLFEHWQSIVCSSINRNIFIQNNISIVEFIKNSLKIGYYCDVWLDTFYIPGKHWYNNSHHTHGLLIYGYNHTNRKFQCLSYDDQNKFDKIIVNENDMINGTSSIYFWKIRLIKNNPNYTIQYDIYRLYKKLCNYLNGICTDDPSRKERESTDQFIQVKAGIAFAEEINNSYKKNKHIPTTLMYSYIEHKQLMFYRIQYISERENLYFDNEQYIQISKMCQFIMNASLKFNMVPTQKILDEISNQMKVLNNIEISYIDKLLQSLETKYIWFDRK